jgi:hypothetical protein
MMAVKAVIPFLVGMMLLTGCANTILTKYQDQQCVDNCDPDSDGRRRTFEQPVIQTCVASAQTRRAKADSDSVQMFIGESGCWLVVFSFYLVRLMQRNSKDAPLLYQPIPGDDEENDDDILRPRSSQDAASPAAKPLVPNADDRMPLKGWKTLLLAIPACCDITGTTLMNVGLLFTAASIYQMTRGALVLFVGLFSVIFLKKKLYLFHWVSLVIVVLGVALVGLAGAIWSGKAPVEAPDSPDLRTIVLLAREVVATTTSDPQVVKTVIGIFLIAGAQIFTASQFCLEVRVLLLTKSCANSSRSGFWRTMHWSL